MSSMLTHQPAIGSRCQRVQVADLVACAAYMRLAQIPAKAHARQWYEVAAASACTGPESLDLKQAEKS
ncbi:hypothetical protein [Saccharopolyspora sp. NPDC002686]|uniref:hypothetical protein n=1 Tax=Saccharopolyspora sp. NPDC002686 TaxID=3154541 RepID=UPI00332498FE